MKVMQPFSLTQSQSKGMLRATAESQSQLVVILGALHSHKVSNQQQEIDKALLSHY